MPIVEAILGLVVLAALVFFWASSDSEEDEADMPCDQWREGGW